MSKQRDYEGVDLVNTGNLNVQCKAVEGNLKYHDILKEMPDEEGQINVIFHKKNRKGVVVILSKDDFYQMILKKRKSL